MTALLQRTIYFALRSTACKVLLNCATRSWAMSKVPPVWDVDFTKMLSEFKVPGVDLDAVLQAQRKNIEALTAANRTAAEGVQAFARRQGEILRQNLAELQTQFSSIASPGAPDEKL